METNVTFQEKMNRITQNHDISFEEKTNLIGQTFTQEIEHLTQDFQKHLHQSINKNYTFFTLNYETYGNPSSSKKSSLPRIRCHFQLQIQSTSVHHENVTSDRRQKRSRHTFWNKKTTTQSQTSFHSSSSQRTSTPPLTWTTTKI